MRCKFRDNWKGVCENEALENKEYCEEHLGLECSSCGKQATHSCHETLTQFVCGAPLCDDCEHWIAEEDGTNRVMKHVKKEDQEHKPWYARDMENDVLIDYDRRFWVFAWNEGAELQGTKDVVRTYETLDKCVFVNSYDNFKIFDTKNKVFVDL